MICVNTEWRKIVSKTQGRIAQLTKILDGLKDSIKRDNESYQMQVEKMQHYTRGKLSVDELKVVLVIYWAERKSSKETKAEGIKQTIAQLKADIEKEKKQQQEREEQRIKREQEEGNKKRWKQKRQAKKETKVISEKSMKVQKLK